MGRQIRETKEEKKKGSEENVKPCMDLGLIQKTSMTGNYKEFERRGEKLRGWHR